MWNKTIDYFMLSIGFTKCESNHRIYNKCDEKHTSFVALYLDDLIITSRTNKLLRESKCALSERF